MSFAVALSLNGRFPAIKYQLGRILCKSNIKRKSIDRNIQMLLLLVKNMQVLMTEIRG